MKTMKASLIFALALAAGAANADKWVSVAGSDAYVDVDTVMIKGGTGSGAVLMFPAKFGPGGTERFTFLVNCAGQHVHVIENGGQQRTEAIYWPSGTAGGDWRDRVCKPFMK